MLRREPSLKRARTDTPPRTAAEAAAAAMAAAGADAEDARACSQEPEATQAAAAGMVGSSSRPAVAPLAEAVQELEGGVSHLKSLLKKVMQSVQAEQDQIQAEQSQLKSQKDLFDAEKNRVTQVLNDSQQVVLNVGGYRFTTTINTLRGAPSPNLFSAMFSGRYDLPRAEDGSLFIDRDGRHFADVLNYLRTQQLAYPPDGTDYKYLLELRAEAEYYGLTGLVALIDRYPYNSLKVVRTGSWNTDDSWMYEDGQDEVIFRVDSPCQLLGVGLCGTDATYLAELEVLEVSPPPDLGEHLSKLGEAAQSFTKSDGPICKLPLPNPVVLQPDKYYMLSVLIKGNESYCCEDCMETVITGGVKVTFECWESPNGTNEQRGQFPELYIRPIPQC